MNTNSFRKLFGLAALASVVAGAQGCVADRPSRNGVFDENQYIRKDFLVLNSPDGAPDPGWYMKATIVQTSDPNPLAAFDMFTGAENSGAIVRFNITSDKLDLVDMRELSTNPAITAQQTNTGSIVNAWPITNVDLKYQINLDGEKTNFYTENQELDWQVRQWVKLNFDKNDFSDLAGLGAYQSLFLNQCADGGNSSSTLVPGSFLVDTPNNYMQWTISVTMPLNLTDQDCMTKFMEGGGGPSGTANAIQIFEQMGRTAVTMNVMYSMVRANPVNPAVYQPMIVGEKDPIRHKYAGIDITNWSRDYSSGLLAANQYQLRYNPNAPIVWYFAAGYPVAEQAMWTRPGGIVQQTNALLKNAGAKAQLSVLNYNDATTLGDGAGPVRVYGDIRYNFIRWETDLDSDSPFLAATNFQPDLRTGQIISASINVAGQPVSDFVGTRVAAYLQTTIGVTPGPFSDPPPDYSPTNSVGGIAPVGTPQPTLPENCVVGATVPIEPANVAANLYASDTLYQKMALYLPPALDGNATPGPTDYVYPHTGAEGTTFYNAYLQLLPYTVYADPAANQFVTPQSIDSTPGGASDNNLALLQTTLHNETLFQQAMSEIDHGGGIASAEITGGAGGVASAYSLVDSFRQLWQQHDDYRYTWAQAHSLQHGDTTDIISFPQIVARSSRHCVSGGGGANPSGATHWQTLAEWEAALVESYYETSIWHEFGHVMGLEHNFMGSIDRNNFPTYTDANGALQYGKLTSSIMEYSSAYDDTYWNNGGAKGATLQTGWLPYDVAAIEWIYGNDLSNTLVQPIAPATTPATLGISGQVSATQPWNDPGGWVGTTETNFLSCWEPHIRYTPLCKPFDVGTTPSEIVAADIESYDWNYQWTNFRNYYKIWDDSNYGTRAGNFISESRRFMAMADFDWSVGELTNKLIQIGIVPPVSQGAVNSGNFYTQLVNDFEADINTAMMLNAAFHEGIIQQTTGQRPYATIFDPYFGDVTQQGIALDKEYSFTEWLGLWPYDNFDPSQSAGLYGSSMVNGSGQTEPAQAFSAAASMLGEKGSWDSYPAFFPAAVSLFGHDTQSVLFTGLGYPQVRDWIGGKIFDQQEYATQYFQQIAEANPTGLNGCPPAGPCSYNPMLPSTGPADIGHSSITNNFIGPDGRRYAWMYIQDRNEYFFVDQDRNPSSYFQVYTYNTDVLTNYDDGNIPGLAYPDLQSTEFMIDSYSLYAGVQGNLQ